MLASESIPTAVSPQTPTTIHIAGDNNGQIAIGDYVVQIGHVSGGLVYLAQPGEQPTPQARPTPVLLRPRPMRGLLDRQVEKRKVTQAVTAVSPTELHGEPGIGKSALLRHLAHQLPLDAFPDGLIHLSAQGLTREDLAQNLFDAFYESPIPVKPTAAALRHALQGKRALILLDDVDLPGDEMEALMDIAPGSVFLWSGGERRLWLDGDSLALGGLPPADALDLLERALGRGLAGAERETAASLCATLKGHPGQIIQAAALLREERVTLEALVARLHGRHPAAVLTLAQHDRLPPEEQRLLAGLVALGDGPVGDKHAARLADLPWPHQTVTALVHRGLVQAEGRTVRLAGGVGPALVQRVDLSALRLQAIDYFTNQVASSALTVAETAVLRPLLTWAVDHGYWPEAIRLTWLLDGLLATGRLWGSWQKVLLAGRQAAQASGDLAAEAWVWHQLGTRALCLGKKQAARRALLKALRLRQQLGDGPGAAVTRHNLNLLLGPPPSDQTGNGPQPPHPRWPAATTRLLLLAMMAGTILIGSLWGINNLAAERWQAVLPTVEPVPSLTVATAVPELVEADIARETAVVVTPAAPTATATATATATTISTVRPSLPACVVQPPAGWSQYQIQRGDTLFSLARSTGTTVATVMQVNCLSSDRINYGTTIYLPARPVATATVTPSLTPTEEIVTPVIVVDTTPITPTVTPTPCPEMSILRLYASGSEAHTSVAWSIVGGCAPYYGSLTVSPRDQTVAQYYTNIPEGFIEVESHTACGEPVEYTLYLFDSTDQKATKSVWVDWSCDDYSDKE